MSTKAASSGVKLTKTSVEKLPLPATGQRIVRDNELRGFAVRITPGGTKAFVLEKRINGRVRRIPIGRFGELTVAQARNRAQQLLGEIALGEDPVAKRRRAKARSVTLAEAYAEFLKSRTRLSEATREEYDRTFTVVLKNWSNRPLESLTGQMILHRHRAVAAERGEQAANNHMRALRSVFNFAIDRYEDGTGQPVLASNPVLILTRTRSWYPVDRRRTLIKPHQLPAWYAALEAQRDYEHPRSMGDTVADFLLLVLFTGLRRREAASLRWRDVDLADRSFTLAQTKNGKPHTLPFSDFLHALFTRRLGAQQNEYVFPGYGGRGCLNEPKRHVRHIVQTSGVPFTVHDLRRTFLTIADTLELSPYTIKRLANHSTNGDVTAGYIISDLERLRMPMGRIERYLLNAIGIQSPMSDNIRLENLKIHRLAKVESV